MSRTPEGASSDLLTIKQAARFLRVSEVSLRRWTDSGALACLRVGGRRERRFRKADLLAFLHDRPASAPDTTGQTAAGACLEGLAIPYGRHVCAFYSSPEGRDRLAIPFLREGVARGDHCMLVADEATAQALTSALAAPLRDPDNLVVQPALRNPTDILAWFRDEFARATRARYTPLRILGDMAAFLRCGASVAAVLDFEARFERELAHRYPVVSLCQYDARAFSGVDVLAALECHGDVFEFPLRQFIGP